MKCHNNVSVVEAATRMGVTPQFLRMALRAGKFPFGAGVQMPGGRWSYYINRERFERYMRGADMTTTPHAEEEIDAETRRLSAL